MTPAQVAEAVFDSHRFVKRLTEAGMEEGLAEVLAEEHMRPWIRNVATRTDVATLPAASPLFCSLQTRRLNPDERRFSSPP